MTEINKKKNKQIAFAVFIPCLILSIVSFIAMVGFVGNEKAFWAIASLVVMLFSSGLAAYLYNEV